jgi:CubicO group peptidase (beta-lactamase class C family)
VNGRFLLAATMILSATAASPLTAQATIGGEWRADVSAFAQRVVAAGLTPGMAVAVAAGDWVAYAQGFGVADLATGRGVTGDTPFYMASSTKSLTATAMTIAAHRGRLDLQAPMTRYLPAARLPDGEPPARIKVHDLAALTHGLRNDGPIVIRTAFTGQHTRAQLLDLLRLHEPQGDYGSFRYNNLGFNLLGMVLEAVYDTPWQDVVDSLVLRPIGMNATTAYVSRIPPDRIAQPHIMTPTGWEREGLAKADANLHAAGGHFASAHDLARYLAAHITGGVVEGERVLPAEPLLLTQRQHVTQARSFGPFTREAWGYGWDIGMWAGDTLISRFGAFSGYRSHMSFMPAHDVGVVVLTNAGGPASDAADLVATYVYDRLLGKPNLEATYASRLDSLVTRAAAQRRGFAEHLAERRARLTPLPRPLAHYAGVYENPALGRMEWRVVAGGLEMRMGVVHSRAEVFEAARDRLRIEVGGSGQVVDFVFPDGGGPAQVARMAGEEFRRVAT